MASQTSRPSMERLAYEIGQFEKIVRLHERIVSGKHPTIKPPRVDTPMVESATSGKATTTRRTVEDEIRGTDLSSPMTAPEHPEHQAPLADTLRDPEQQGAMHVLPNPPKTAANQAQSKALQKSEGLLEDDISVQRQALERALKDEAAERSVRKPPHMLRETEIDLSDILSKALKLVSTLSNDKAAPEVVHADRDPSDSFDDNTFYSSQFETPESRTALPVHRDPAEAMSSDVAQQRSSNKLRPDEIANDQPPLNMMSAHADQSKQTSHEEATSAGVPKVASFPHAHLVPGLNNYTGQESTSTSTRKTQDAHAAREGQSQSVVPGGSQSTLPVAHVYGQGPSKQLSIPQNVTYPASPLLREAPAQRVAGNSRQVTGATVSGKSQPAESAVAQQAKGAPAQVTALRAGPALVTSPESSSQGGRRGETKQSKKKKRKAADRQGRGAEEEPLIKPEPRSPSPLQVAAYGRASKRQRHARGRANEPTTQPRRVGSVNRGFERQQAPGSYGADATPGYASAGAYAQNSVGGGYSGGQWHGREALPEYRLGETYRSMSAAAPAFPGEAVQLPGPLTQSLASYGYREPQGYYREYREVASTGARPAADGFAQPAAPLPPRVFLDTYGREYAAPSRAFLPRPLATTFGLSDETGLEAQRQRAATRPVSQHAGQAPYMEGGGALAEAATQYALPRRSFTQPDFSPYGFAEGYMAAGYAAPPMPPPMPPTRGFVDVAEANARAAAAAGEGPRGYPARSASLIPAEAVRYEMPRGYAALPANGYAEATAANYGAGVAAERPRELAQPYMQGYGPRPAEMFGRAQARAASEIAFIEHPRGATHEIVYADDARREVYR